MMSLLNLREKRNFIENFGKFAIFLKRRIKEADKDLSEFLTTNINDLDEVKGFCEGISCFSIEYHLSIDANTWEIQKLHQIRKGKGKNLKFLHFLSFLRFLHFSGKL